jgi:uncharacterized coiled-coil protein SlyX
MWPFKSIEQRIGELEDKIAGKKARLDCIVKTFSSLDRISSHWVTERVDLAEQIGSLSNRLERMQSAASSRLS